MYSTILLLICFIITTSHADIFPQCEGLNKVFIPSPNSKNCEMFIFCDDLNSKEGKCEEGYRFKPDEGTCDYKENVKCQTGEDTTLSVISATPATVTVSTLNTPTTTSTNIPNFTQAPTSTAKPVSTTIITTLANYQTTTTEQITEKPIKILQSCPIDDDPSQVVLIPNNKSCSHYYICYHGNPVAMQCTNYLHFNPNTLRCDYPENVNCIVSTFYT